jgi:hypothetical protein
MRRICSKRSRARALGALQLAIAEGPSSTCGWPSRSSPTRWYRRTAPFLPLEQVEVGRPLDTRPPRSPRPSGSPRCRGRSCRCDRARGARSRRWRRSRLAPRTGARPSRLRPARKRRTASARRRPPSRRSGSRPRSAWARRSTAVPEDQEQEAGTRMIPSASAPPRPTARARRPRRGRRCTCARTVARGPAGRLPPVRGFLPSRRR